MGVILLFLTTNGWNLPATYWATEGPFLLVWGARTFGCPTWGPMACLLGCLSIILSHSFSFLSLLPQENGQSSERAGNRCPDTRFSLMRIRNILIKTHNPPLNPSLQNHLHSLVLLHTAAVMAHSGPLFCLASSLTEGYISLCLPSVSVIFDPLSLDFQTRCAEGPENSAFVCTPMLSLVWNGKWDICLMRRWTGTCRPTER